MKTLPRLYECLCYTINMEKFTTTSVEQTRKMGEILAKELKGGEVICLEGELGSGKTAFAQGILKGLGVEGPYTSPTFLIMKQYKKEIPGPKLQISNKFKIQNSKFKIRNIYHVDAYRVGVKDILELGWEEIVKSKNNIIIVEWADKIKKIVPVGAVWVKFKIADVETRHCLVSTEKS